MYKLIAVGTVGKDSTLSTTKNNFEVLNFTIAVNIKNKNETKTEWVKCALFGVRAAKLQQYIIKGLKVLVEGTPSISQYTDRNGKLWVSQNLMIDNIEFLGRGRASEQEAIDPDSFSASNEIRLNESKPESPMSQLTIDDVPF